MAQKLLFCRHGESTANAQGIVAGTLDVELTSDGKEIARQLATRLHDAPLERVISSRLKRAVDTAAPIAESHFMELEQWDELHEVCFGSAEGTPRFSKTEPSALELLGLGKLEGAETLEELEQRAHLCWNRLAGLPQELICIVGHASFTAIMFAVREGIPRHGFVEYRKNFTFENCEVKVVE